MKGFGKKVMALFLGTCLLFGAACSNGEAEPAGNGGGNTSAAGSPGSAGTSGNAGTSAGNGGGGQGMGRFVETEYFLPDGVEYMMDLRLLEDGTLRMAAIGTNPLMLYSSKDEGKSWEPVEISMEQLGADKTMIQSARWSPSGQLFIIYMNQDEVMAGNMKTYCLLFDQKGTGKELTIDLPPLSSGSGNSNRISDVHFAPDGGLYIVDVNQTIYQIDLESGKILKNYANPDTVVETFAVIGKNLLVKTEDGVEFYDLETGKSLTRQEALNEYIKAFDSRHPSEADVSTGVSDYVYTAGKDGNDLYFCDETGLYHYTLDGSVVEQVIDGGLNSLSSTTLKVRGLIRSGEEGFLIFGTENSKAKLIAFNFDSSVPTLPGTELTVYALEDNTSLRQAIRMYQHDNPDVYVTLEIGMSGDDGITAADAIRTLNTNLMAGKGPDVLILDGMTIGNYVEKGMLTDLSDVIGEVSSADGLFENLVNAYQSDGKVMAVPVCVMLPMILGNADGLGSVTDLKTLTAYVESLRQKNPDAPGICGTETVDGLLRWMYGISSAAWLKDGNTLDEAALNEFFDCLKRISEAEKSQIPAGNESIITSGGGNLYLSYNMNLFSYLGGDSLICAGQMDSFQVFAVLETFRSQGDAYQSLNGQTAGVFQPMLTVGVNAKGDQSETAKGFVKYLLGKDFQSNENLGGLPVNRAAFDAGKKNPFPSDLTPSMSSMGASGELKDLEIQWPSENSFAELQKRMESVNIPADSNQVIREAVEAEAKNLLEGGASVQDAVQNVIKKVNLYLSEQ
jgi:ABC-type glycerol-3-phosphate transport system substrate-binding protein